MKKSDNPFQMKIGQASIVLLALIFSVFTQKTTAQELPNILWISVEDISPDIGCYGDKNAHTPVLDQLAQEGMRYTNAIANAPVCAPARSTIISGMYATSLGSQHMRCEGIMPEGFNFFPQYLREKGYYCSNNVKEDYNLNYESSMIWDESNRNAHWRNRKDKTQPFFAIFNLTLTHESCIILKEKHDKLTKTLPAHLRAKPETLNLPPYYPDTPKVRELWARHYDNISMMDIRVGEILKELEEDGLTENTIVIFFSDHGTGTPRHKRWLYDSGLKVPLIVKAPTKYKDLVNAKPGTINDELVTFVDLAPTMLNLAGISKPGHMQGNAFLGKNVRPPAKYAYSFRDRMDERYDMQRSVRSKDFKYIRYYEAYKPFTQYMNTPEEGEIMKAIRFAHEKGTLPPAAEHMMLSNKPPEELFDLKNDPWELNNLANKPEYKAKLLEMRNAHAVWSDETKDTGLIPETIMRTWEKESGKSIYELLRQKEIPIDEIRTTALSKNRKELLEALNHKNEAVRYWAAISLGNLTFDKKKLKDLGKSLQDPIPAVRIAAARAICNSACSEKSFEVLKNEIQSQDEWTRLLTAQVLDEIDEKAKPLESQLQKVIDKNDTNKYVIRVANRALNELNKTNNVVD